MLRKYLVFCLTVLLINLSLSTSVSAETKIEKEVKSADKIKKNVIKLGTGKDSRIEVKLRDKTKLKGYVSEINEDNFVVVNEETGTVTKVPYSRAKQVKGNNLSTGVTVAIVIGVVLAIAAIVGAVSSD